MKTDFEAYYASLRRQALRQMEARQRECSALDPAFDALQAKRSRAFSMLAAPCARTRGMWAVPSSANAPAG